MVFTDRAPAVRGVEAGFVNRFREGPDNPFKRTGEKRGGDPHGHANLPPHRGIRLNGAGQKNGAHPGRIRPIGEGTQPRGLRRHENFKDLKIEYFLHQDTKAPRNRLI